MQPMVDYPKHDQSYIDPNHLISSGNGVTFIYSTDGNLYTNSSKVSHKEMLESDEIWNDILSHPLGVDYRKFKSIPKEGFQRRSIAENTSILGRTGVHEGNHVISFWGEKRQFLLTHLKTCLKKLMERNLVDAETQVYTMIFKPSSVDQVIKFGFEDQSKEVNSKNYVINGQNYTWEGLRAMRAQTHTNPSKENTTKLCALLSSNILSQYPELRSLVPTKCGEQYNKQSKLSRYLGSGAPSSWPIYPTIGDCTVNFKDWLLKEDQ